MGMHGFSKLIRPPAAPRNEFVSIPDGDAWVFKAALRGGGGGHKVPVSIPDGDAWVFKAARGGTGVSNSYNLFQSPMGMHGFSKLIVIIVFTSHP